MMNKNFIKIAFLHAVGVLVYIIFVVSILQNAERIFGKMNNIVGPASFLMLFVTSAAVTGGLTLGRPVLWYWDGKKKEAVELLIYTVGWLLVFTLALLTTQFLSK